MVCLEQPVFHKNHDKTLFLEKGCTSRYSVIPLLLYGLLYVNLVSADIISHMKFVSFTR
jgi:hypothetical protein